MSDKIPVTFLAKMGIYEVKIQDVTLRVRVVDSSTLLDLAISELRSEMNETANVVGLGVIHDSVQSGGFSYSSKTHLQLCVGTRCLLVQNINSLATQFSSRHQSLTNFLTDEGVCFVGDHGTDRRLYHLPMGCKGVIEMGELAARILKKPELTGAADDLARIAAVIGLPPQPYSCSVSSVDIKWDAKVFTDEQVKYAVRDVYAAYLIGSKLMSML